MSQLLPKHTAYPIGDKVFHIAKICVSDHRKALPLVSPILPSYAGDVGDEEVQLKREQALAAIEGMGPALLFSLGGNFKGFDELVKIFARYTIVDFPDGRQLSLSAARDAEKNQEEAFDPIEDMYLWMDACIQHNFSSIVAKMKDAVDKSAAVASTSQAPQ